jgi:hypothetical protein
MQLRDSKMIVLFIMVSLVKYAVPPPFMVQDISALSAQPQISVSFASLQIPLGTLSNITSSKSRLLSRSYLILSIMIFSVMKFKTKKIKKSLRLKTLKNMILWKN